MTTTPRASDEGYLYGGTPEIDAAVRRLLATFKPLTPTQRATLSALFNKPRRP